MSRASSIALAAGAVALFGAAAGLTQSTRAVADSTNKVQPVTVENTSVPVSVLNTSVPVSAADPSAVTLRPDPAVVNGFSGSIVGGKTALVVQEANNGQHPFEESVNFSIADTIIVGVGFSNPIPVGKRAVIESVSVFVDVPQGQQVVTSAITTRTFDLAGTPHGAGISTMPTRVATVGTTDDYAGTLAVHKYAEPGTQIGALVERDSGSGVANCSFVIVGYLVDAP
jgi:hypothetical protein